VADGPDEVHKMVIARRELGRSAKRSEGEGNGGDPAAAQPAGSATGAGPG
ncbi:MAG: hypothetical protein H0V15_01150, partial [Solirubrobacterales bacterium]|nr:hypothetical protein [Solirubrobacterales bacterium]